MTKSVDSFINRNIFINISIGRRYIRLGLIIIIIAYEIMNRIIGKEVFQLAIELGGKGFVMSNY